jgi:hypothetical protein
MVITLVFVTYIRNLAIKFRWVFGTTKYKEPKMSQQLNKQIKTAIKNAPGN